MKTALTEQEFKAILQDAYQAGERASERNKEIDRLLDGGTKSCPAQPSFENYYQSMLAMQPIEAEKEAIEFNKYTQELPKQEERDVSKGEIEKAKTTAKANKLIKMFDDAIEGRLIKFQPKSDISEEEVEGKLSISAVRDLFNEGYDYLTIYTKEEFDKWLDAKLFQSDKPEVKP